MHRGPHLHSLPVPFFRVTVSHPYVALRTQPPGPLPKVLRSPSLKEGSAPQWALPGVGPWSFWTQGPFSLLKIIEVPKELVYL